MAATCSPHTAMRNLPQVYKREHANVAAARLVAAPAVKAGLNNERIRNNYAQAAGYILPNRHRDQLHRPKPRACLVSAEVCWNVYQNPSEKDKFPQHAAIKALNIALRKELQPTVSFLDE